MIKYYYYICGMRKLEKKKVPKSVSPFSWTLHSLAARVHLLEVSIFPGIDDAH